MPEADTVEVLVVDLLEWLDAGPRRYDEVLESWRTSCPRLPVWETAVQRGYVVRHQVPGEGQVISLSPGGAAHLDAQRQPSRAP